MTTSVATTRQMLEGHIGIWNRRYVRRIDWLLLLIVAALAGIGIMTLISANRSASLVTPYYLKQSLFFGTTLFLALFVACIDYRFLISLGPFAYAVLILLLLGVNFFGYEVNGAQRWIDLGLFSLQPSEQSKLALILMLAWYFTLIGPRIQRLHWFLLTFVIAAVPALLILKQPNLGTAAALGPIVFAMLFMAGCKKWHFAAIIVSGLAVLPVAWTFMEDYQRTRVLSFMDPAADPKGSGYHTIQSMITVGSGGLTGKGYLDGTQTYLSYLPEHHTDFIFSLLAEEWGFMGATLCIALFCLLLLRSLSIAQKSPDLGGSLIVVGIVTLLAFHICINIAITVGMFPVTGIPLPFLSYGGSFYLTTMLCVGVLLSVYVRRDLI